MRTPNGRVYPARILASDATADLALLQVQGTGSFRALGIAPTGAVRRGDGVLALGFPQIQIQGLEPKVTDGIISSLSGLADDASRYQISNPIQPGNSGGPLVAEDGRLVGVVVSTLSARYMQRNFGTVPQNVNYAIKSGVLLDFLARQRSGVSAAASAPVRNRAENVAEVEDSLGLVIASSPAPQAAPGPSTSPGRIPAASLPPMAAPAAPDPEPRYTGTPLTLVVPFAEGGPTDFIARRVARAWARVIKRPVVVRNVLGESGLLGTREVVRAPTDGLTLLYQNTSLVPTALGLGAAGTNYIDGLDPVGKVVEVPVMLVARPRLAADTLQELQGRAADAPALRLAHAASGSVSHLCAQLLVRELFQGQRFELQTYPGSAPAVRALMDGHADLTCDQSLLLAPQVSQRNVKGLAVVSSQRSSAAFSVPTLIEQGSSLMLTNWGGVFAPKGVRAEVIEELSGSLAQALQDIALRQDVAPYGVLAQPEEATPAYLSGLVHKDLLRFQPLLQRP